VVAEDSLARFEDARQRWQKSPQSHFELCLRRATGERITVEVSLSAVADQDGRVTSLFALVSDITARKLNEERVLYLAFYDTLTALPNRFLFSEHMEQALRQRQRVGNMLALLFIDLDDFKQVNDCHGHDVGDELLREVARRLVSCVRASDTVSRQGGDEFIVLLNNLSHGTAAEQVAQKMLDALAAPVIIGALSLRISASIGIALCPEHGEDASTLRRMADIAMYRAKQAGKHCLATYTETPGTMEKTSHAQ
jgi:diguanylate cyclase (GGDEF)-like protein